jgi:hypothetical protein
MSPGRACDLGLAKYLSIDLRNLVYYLCHFLSLCNLAPSLSSDRAYCHSGVCFDRASLAVLVVFSSVCDQDPEVMALPSTVHVQVRV